MTTDLRNRVRKAPSRGGFARGQKADGQEEWFHAGLAAGRRTWVHLSPRPASLEQLRWLAHRINAQSRRRANRLGSTGRVVAELSAELARTQKRLNSALERLKRKQERDQDRVMQRAKKRVDLALKHSAAASDSLAEQLKDSSDALELRGLMDHVLAASALPVVNAYGQRGSPFSPHNLTVGLSLLVWLLGDDFLRLLNGQGFELPGKVDIWSLVAPLGNLLTAYFLLEGRQHQHLLSGKVDLAEFGSPILSMGPELTNEGAVYTYSAKLTPHQIGIAPDYDQEFRSTATVPTSALVRSIQLKPGVSELRRSEVQASVVAGLLKLELVVRVPQGTPPPLAQVDVMWLLATAASPS